MALEEITLGLLVLGEDSVQIIRFFCFLMGSDVLQQRGCEEIRYDFSTNYGGGEGACLSIKVDNFVSTISTFLVKHECRF